MQEKHRWLASFTAWSSIMTLKPDPLPRKFFKSWLTKPPALKPLVKTPDSSAILVPMTGDRNQNLWPASHAAIRRSELVVSFYTCRATGSVDPCPQLSQSVAKVETLKHKKRKLAASLYICTDPKYWDLRFVVGSSLNCYLILGTDYEVTWRWSSYFLFSYSSMYDDPLIQLCWWQYLYHLIFRS